MDELDGMETAQKIRKVSNDVFIVFVTAFILSLIHILYDLDHPKEYVPKSIEVQRACMKEREFYVA